MGLGDSLFETKQKTRKESETQRCYSTCTCAAACQRRVPLALIQAMFNYIVHMRSH